MKPFFENAQDGDEESSPPANGHALPFTVVGFAHPVSTLASGVKDADGIWVAKCHPLNGTKSDLKRAEKMAQLFAAAPDLLAALVKMVAEFEDADTIGTIDEHPAILAARAAIAKAKARGGK